jgi:hypothetical protein
MGQSFKALRQARKFLVKKKFARKSSEEEIKKSGEQVKWYSDQLKRALNFDEMERVEGPLQT